MNPTSIINIANKIVYCFVAANVVYKAVEYITTTTEPLFPFLYSKLELTSDSGRCKYSIKQELELSIKQNLLTKVEDGLSQPSFTLLNGLYYINDPKIGKLSISYKEDKIIIYSLTSSVENIKGYLSDVYGKYCSSEKIVVSYLSNNDEWSMPIIRRPTMFLDNNLTCCMKEALEDIKKFKESEQLYCNNGIPYRKGYLFYGLTGSGKTSVVEIIAKLYGMSIYNLNLNANKMNDTWLMKLIVNVPPNSIIVLDEIDKQLEHVNNNKTANVSIGGLLSAIDGPHRLSHSTIVIMTSNSRSFIDVKYESLLFRKGRIDTCIEFSQPITNINL